MDRRPLSFAGLLLAFLVGAPAQADSLESVLSPGPVIQGHAKYETDCKQCHVRFNKAGQKGVCLDCHKEVAGDVQTKRRYHGRLEQNDCRRCHTEHKGRSVNIAPLDSKTFDHRLTEFPLKGAHGEPKVKCRDCHVAGKKYREAPSDCYSCHRKDDKHKGSLGRKCADCHVETNWKKTKFDHSKTRFPLAGKHIDVPCKDCHRRPDYKGAPTRCVACHRKDDTHKGRFGPKCESCHNDRDWKTIIFNHERDTKYPLRGAHRLTKCASCHAPSKPLYGTRIASACIDCHRKDDDRKGHKGLFGIKCQSCHTEVNWTRVIFNHDRDTKYPLRGKHAESKCSSCHTGHLYREKLKTDCLSCHKEDDKHEGQIGPKCENCHNERSWKTTRFDHGLTRFPLLGKHADVKCKECHKSLRYKDAPTACYECHKKEDVHKRRLGTKCEECHNARNWKQWKFDHNKQTQFRLDGAHVKLNCLECHKKPVNGKAVAPGTCGACHISDDVHDGRYGNRCERCHNTTNFKQIKPGVVY
ncbi:MAG: cytochrome C [Candidatus Muproteobacteria bacterium RBG_16_62_13]|uniref:Cytochrome C n=1 Tax=Candidatus Muproteobacteria bacterium RBG_16_62_13 TaxID=1817756 RepID=A0A1F6T7C5_9PROT|nr:MAG: cytochrome C [Candidatus Muproteobacteria bacterium RBG_16_62_13]